MLQEFDERSLYKTAMDKVHEKANKKTQAQIVKEWLATKAKACCPCLVKDNADDDGNNDA